MSTLARALAPFALPLAFLVVELPLLFATPAVGDNFQFWAAGHMAATGVSPYARSSWEAFAAYGAIPGGVATNTIPINLAITQQVWLYPPQTAFLFAPFGLLPFEIGVPLLHAFILLSALAALVFVAWRAGLRGPHLAFALTLAVVSQPLVISVRNGHPIGLLLIGGVLLLVGLRERRDLFVVSGVAMLTLKPQLVIPVGLFALGYALVKGDGRRIGIMALTAAAVTLPFEILTPFPIAAIGASAGERLAVDLSTLGTLARDLGGDVVLTLALSALTLGACALAFLWASRGERPVVGGASLFVLSLALSPYVHDYDLLLGVPAAFAIVAVGAMRRSGIFTAVAAALSIVAAPWLLFYFWPLVGEGARRFQGGPLGAVPLVLAFGVLFAVLADRGLHRRAATDRSPHPPERQVA